MNLHVYQGLPQGEQAGTVKAASGRRKALLVMQQ